MFQISNRLLGQITVTIFPASSKQTFGQYYESGHERFLPYPIECFIR